MANPATSSLSLYEEVYHKNTARRAADVTILFLLLSLLLYRLSSFNNHGFGWFLAFLCESCFTFFWVLNVNMKWTPLTYETYPQRLQEQKHDELPPLDVFVTTADAELEPPMITVNTVLSLLAVEYPAQKLACYVSDDGCSPLTFYSLVEASKFAKLWVPFCKKYQVQVRAPFRYFLVESAEPPIESSWEFQQDWKKMKEEYEQLGRNIERAAKKPDSFELTGELAIFANTDRKNHPAIVKVIWENKEGLSNGIPHLIYISREKQPKQPHHYKAGAMNVLTRVSGLMTNAPFMLNVDCDMYANDPKLVLQAMCLLLGSEERDCAFVQFPQYFHDSPEDWIAVFQEFAATGIAGIQGPYYEGTGTFHKRKVIYGLCPDELEHQGKYLNSVIGKIAYDEYLKKFGNSKEFIESAVYALQGKSSGFSSSLSDSLEAAHQVASCGYEYHSSWGKKFGWFYGSAAEDALTGLIIHTRGWGSRFCSPNPRAFLGCGASALPSMMKQQKRWSMGLFEILLSKHNPISAIFTGKLLFRQCLVYMWLVTWGLRSIPELFYVALPAYSIITNSSFLPKMNEPGIIIPFALLVTFKLYTLSEYIHVGSSIYTWWVSHCTSRIVETSAFFFGVVNAVLKVFGLGGIVFEITPKSRQSSTSSDDGGGEDEVMFDDSPYFVPGTTIVLVHLAALAIGLLGLQQKSGLGSAGFGEYFCSVYVVICFFPFLEGLFSKGKHGIPLSTIYISVALALLFVQICKTSSVN